MPSITRAATRAALVALVGVLAACGGFRRNEPARDPYLISGFELDQLPNQSATVYEAVRMLRPRWLDRTYAPGSSNAPIIVYVDNLRQGGVSVLNGMSAASIRMVRYYTPSQAQARFGSGYLGGVIQVVTLEER